MEKETILVVDPDATMNELIRTHLEREGFPVISASNGADVISLVEKYEPALILMEAVLPGMNGIEVCKELRRNVDVPILFVSSKTGDSDKILGLSVGGDDYITKPFNPKELVARVKAHLRRSALLERVHRRDERQKLSFAGLTIDPEAHLVQVNGNAVRLSAQEFKLLLYLAQNPHRVFRNDQLFGLLWDKNYVGDTRTVMVHICNLRKKIEEDPAHPKFILTVRGVGYKFSYPEEDVEPSREFKLEHAGS